MWKWIGFAFGLYVVLFLGSLLFFTKTVAMLLNASIVAELSILLLLIAVIGGWSVFFTFFVEQSPDKATLWIYGLSILVGISGHLFTNLVGLDQILSFKLIFESFFTGFFFWGMSIAGGMVLIREPFRKHQ